MAFGRRQNPRQIGEPPQRVRCLAVAKRGLHRGPGRRRLRPRQQEFRAQPSRSRRNTGRGQHARHTIVHGGRGVGELALRRGADVGGPRYGAAPLRSGRFPIPGALLELCQLDRQGAVAAERPATDEKGPSRFVPHPVISERLSPLAIGLFALRGSRRPAS